MKEKKSNAQGGIMRFGIIEREPEMLFDSFRNNLEKLVRDNYNQGFRPCCEIRENEKEYKLKFMLPGMSKEDINVELADNVLTVKAEFKKEESPEDEVMHISEFTYGNYEKSIRFEQEIDDEKSTSEYKNGILHITLAKKQENKKDTVKKISVK